MNAIIYCRFSPRPNATECDSNDKQRERCIAHCEKADFWARQSHEDRAVSGSKLLRPGLSAAIDSIIPGDVFVVDSSDRLARDLLVYLTIVGQITEKGARIEFADGTPSPSDASPEEECFSNIMAVIAHYQRRGFARRTKNGLKKKKDRGEWLGKAPIGWQYNKETKQLEENATETEAIRRILYLYRQGNTSSDALAEIMSEGAKKLRGKPWSARTIRKLLKKHLT